MKKLLSGSSLMLILSYANAQYSNPIQFLHSSYGNGYGSKLYYVDEGDGVTSFRIAVRGNSANYTDAFYIRASDQGNNTNIGIGTPATNAQLTVAQPVNLGSGAQNSILLTKVGGYATNFFQNNIWLVRNSAGSDWTETRLHDGISVDGSFLTPQVNTKTWWERDPYYDVQSWGTAGNTYVTINQGNVGIGTTNTHTYKLAVNGSAIATSMTVQGYTSWPDYVFKPAYTLPTLTEVKTYIDQNHHLPEIPSAEQIEKDGLNLGEMNKLLVKKVEELTLYLIEKDKKQNEQEEEIKLLKQQMQVLMNKPGK
jgi:hypothetical protein